MYNTRTVPISLLGSQPAARNSPRSHRICAWFLAVCGGGGPPFFSISDRACCYELVQLDELMVYSKSLELKESKYETSWMEDTIRSICAFNLEMTRVVRRIHDATLFEVCF